MKKLIIHREPCKSCQYCVVNCPKGVTTSEREELGRLRREIRTIREERERY